MNDNMSSDLSRNNTFTLNDNSPTMKSNGRDQFSNAIQMNTGSNFFSKRHSLNSTPYRPDLKEPPFCNPVGPG